MSRVRFRGTGFRKRVSANGFEEKQQRRNHYHTTATTTMAPALARSLPPRRARYR